MLGTTTAVTSMAATTDAETVSGGSVAVDTTATKALEELDANYRYDGDDLGVTYTKDATTFKVWSPTATEIKVNIFTKGSDDEQGASKVASYRLEKEDATGIWKIKLTGEWKDYYYTYTITVVNPTTGETTTSETQDVYSKAVGVNGNRSMVVDLDSTDPDGWDGDSHVLFNNAQEAVVWEVHVRDFSISDTSGVSDDNKGKYLAFTEGGTKINSDTSAALYQLLLIIL